MDQDTIGKVADATKAMAETGDTALKVAGKFGSYFDLRRAVAHDSKDDGSRVTVHCC